VLELLAGSLDVLLDLLAQLLAALARLVEAAAAASCEPMRPPPALGACGGALAWAFLPGAAGRENLPPTR
jgi:hypothetical protein